MTLYGKFLSRQAALAHQGVLADALATFDPRRTVTLYELLTNHKMLVRLGAHDWLDVRELRKRINAYCQFMHLVRGLTLRDEPLIFFQSIDTREERRAYEGSPRKLREPCWQARYLHTRTNFSPETLGSWELRTRIIKPGCAFSNWDGRGITKNPHDAQVRSGSLTGYRLPNYMELLGVSSKVATNYLARIILHDLGHGALPDIGGEREILHDVAMVYAMDMQVQRNPVSFERLVYRECTDPCLFLDVEEEFETISPAELTLVQRTLYDDLHHKFAASTLVPTAPLWELTKDVTEHDAPRHVRDYIKRMVRSGFVQYQQAA